MQSISPVRRTPALSALHALRFVGFGAAVCLLGCTDVDLYRGDGITWEADRVTLQGRVCAEDTSEAALPIKTVLVVDRAAALDTAGNPLGTVQTWDPSQQRVDLLDRYLQSQLAQNPDAEFAIVGMGGVSQVLAPTDGSAFTNDISPLMAGLGQLRTLAPCTDGICRDPVAALRTARSIIEGDLANITAGERVLTQYQVVVMIGGKALPFAQSIQCCDYDDTACRTGGSTVSEDCEDQLELEVMSATIAEVESQGALGLRFHFMQLDATSAATGDLNDLATRLEALSFTLGGTYQRFTTPATLNGRMFDVLSERETMRAKFLIVTNQNAVPTGDGFAVDSDADGASDEDEVRMGTSPGNWDTDGDEIGDLVETLVNFDPLTPDTPVACRGVDPGDDDLDGLSNCDEALLGTEATLVDTDGDALPDPLEVFSFVDYLTADAETDSDGDGVSNGQEVRIRSNPLTGDVARHLAEGYRYEVTDEGVVRELASDQPLLLEDAVRILSVGPATTPGRGQLVYQSGLLSWRDPGETQPGTEIDLSDPANIPSDGVLILPADSRPSDEEDGEGAYIEVFVDVRYLPPSDAVEPIRISYLDRQCITYTVRNVQLMDVQALDDGSGAHINRILLYFAEKASGAAVSAPGPVRIAEIPVYFVPPATRIPNSPAIQILDDDFVRR